MKGDNERRHTKGMKIPVNAFSKIKFCKIVKKIFIGDGLIVIYLEFLYTFTFKCLIININAKF